MPTEIVRQAIDISNAIELRHLAVSDEHRKLARATVAKGLNDAEFELLLYECRRAGVHPLDKMLIPVVRTLNGERRLTFTTTVDLLRSRAAETGEYGGSDDAVFQETTKDVIAARVTVWRLVQGQRCPFTASAYWSEYYPGDKDGFMWRTKPHVMLGKCAEGLALRKAFPKQLAGMYVQEELARTDEPQRRERIHATMPANVELMSPSPEANRGHEDAGLGRKPKTVEAKTAEANGAKNGLYLILKTERKTKKKGGQPYLVLDVVLNGEQGDQEGKLYCWHQSFFEYLEAVKGENLLAEVTEQKTGDQVYFQIEHILELGGQPFVNDKPAAPKSEVEEVF
jgi:phage recombination protein Bet